MKDGRKGKEVKERKDGRKEREGRVEWKEKYI